MILLNDFCHVCGNIVDFEISESATLFREAKCPICGASLRNSDMAKMILKNIAPDYTSLRELPNEISKDFQMLNTCSSGSLHNALGKLKGYLTSEFFCDVANGDKKHGVYCVDLCNIPFGENVFDLVISEDVFEHISDYHRAFREIYRVLKPGGCHIFTVPVHEGRKTVSRIGNEKVIYHGDPLDEANGCVVITDFGDDLINLLNSINYSCKKYLLHKFYEPIEITNCDFTYDEYLKKREKLEDYFKYNSIVFVAKKDKRMDEIKFTGERFIPGIDDKKLSIEHYQRYKSILPYVRDKVVLDAACGEGYGSNLIAECATYVIGMDIDDYSIERATKKYATHKNNLKYIQGSIADLSVIETASIDVLVSFETIEHVSEDIQWQFLKEIKRVLKNDGILYMSTPNKKIYSDLYHYTNEFHVKEFYYDEFLTFLNSAFQYVKLYNQSFEVVSLLEDIKSGEGTVRLNNDNKLSAEDAKYFVAVASNVNISKVKISSVFFYDSSEYERYIQRILSLQDEVEERNKHIKKLDQQIINHERHYEDVVKLLSRNIDEKEEISKKLKENNKQLEENNKQLEEKCKQLEQEYNNKLGHIELLLEVEREYEREKQTKSYRLAKKFQRLGDFILPPNSKRRFFVGLLYKVIRKPRLMLHVINPKRIRNYIKYMRLEGMEGVNKRYKEAEDKEWMILHPEEKLEISISEKILEKDDRELSIRDFDRIVIPKFEIPTVSIIIPVYNEFQYTYNCIKSIVKNSGSVSYEVIVANDCSTDITSEINQIVENVKLVSTQENVRFLLNCNNAAKQAKGKYILFLNNDTQVQENWLEPLVSLIERDNTIGMVGSKLVYPDGRLQEAGGILWNDGSAWNYGNRSDAEAPEFNYVKEADYISGAAIMISKSLWEEIGGFDEDFAPAYCEDSDLAFEVRKRGYKVLYQPQSVVVHFEGVSNGTDTSVGLKAYQVRNQKKFFEKWKDVLEKEHFPNAENVFCARDKSAGKPVILMIDHYVPQYDKDAGSRTVFQYLSLFVKKGYNVKFIGDNFYRHEPYTTVLQQMGIEVLYGSYYCKNWKQWIKENAEHIDYVFLNRPHISVKYIDFLKKETNAKIIYYGHDLHFLREYRSYELTHDPENLKLSNKWKKDEFELMRKADLVYYPSNVEVEEIAKIDSNIKAKAIVAYMFENVCDVDYSYNERKDLMFIGGFAHTPNIDGVLWFAKEVFPIIKASIPNIKFYILGSKPTVEIEKLSDDNIEVKGFVTDEELASYYKKCKISVVPLRYGAGIKGKVVEAMKFGIPVVTTTTGAEGIVGADNILCVEDEPDILAKKIIELYHDKETLTKMSEKSIEYIKENFSEKNAWDVIGEDFT